MPKETVSSTNDGSFPEGFYGNTIGHSEVKCRSCGSGLFYACSHWDFIVLEYDSHNLIRTENLMGIPSERFISHVDENLICGICHGVFVSPVLTDCGHTFCALCMKQWLQTPNSNVDPQTPKRCPTCRHQFLQTSSLQTGTEEIGVVFTVARPVLSLRNFIGSMLVHCENTARGCTTVESVEVMTSGIHTCVCSYTPVDCAGCGQTVNQLELAAHQLGCFGIQAELQDTDADNLSLGVINKTDEQTQTETFFDKGTPDESQWLSALKYKTTVCCCTQETQTEFVESECSTTKHKPTFVRKLTSLYILNRSLVKLVYALKIELSTSQAELRLCKLKQKAVAHDHMDRVYQKTL